MMDKVEVSKRLIEGADLWEMIQEVGLHNDPVVTEHYGSTNQHLLRHKGMLQEPHQLRDALQYLGTKKISTYFEVGTFYGSATLVIYSYLKYLNPKLTGISIDIVDRGWEFLPYAKSIGLDILVGTSDEFKGHRSDICFIDGNHTYEWVKKDYENIGRFAKYCMFHDIQDSGVRETDEYGTIRFWNEIKTKKDKEFLYHPDGLQCFGIGVKV